MMIRGEKSPRITDRIFDALAGLMLWAQGTSPSAGCVVIYHTLRFMQVFSSLSASKSAPQ